MSKREKVTATEATPERTASSIFGRKIITNDLLLDLIISCCSPATLLCFSQTCRTIHLLVKSYTRRTFKIDHLLSRFFSSPLEFRRLQARTATLISGSTALQFFDRTFYPESDLDIYIYSQFVKEVGDFLLKENYVFMPSKTQFPDFSEAADKQCRDYQSGDNWDMYDFRAVASVFTFTKECSGELLKVQMLVAATCPIEVILHFHSSQ